MDYKLRKSYELFKGGQYQECIDYSLRAVVDTEDKNTIKTLYCYVARSYGKLNKLDKAMEYIKEAENYCYNEDDKYFIRWNKAIIFRPFDKQLSRNFYIECLHYYDQIEDLHRYSSVLGNIAIIDQDINKSYQAIEILKDIGETNTDYYDSHYTDIFDIHMELGEDDKAVAIIDKIVNPDKRDKRDKRLKRYLEPSTL